MAKVKTIPLPKGKYIEKLEINDQNLQIQYKKRKKVALLFVCINQRYWEYLKQVVEDAKKHFLPQHNVDFFYWTDMPEGEMKVGTQFQTEAIEWPAPTLMRYHLFLQQEEKLKEYDYIFYLDADMRILSKISDEIIGEGLTAAEHPMYSLRKEYVPPYEPNKESTAYIPRLGAVVDDNGKPRFKPYYVAGGFQGGVAKKFLKAMKVMKANIDLDFNKNYTAIWNDESHWNKYLYSYDGPLIVLPPAYVYPDSLIREYYEPIWGRKYEPKILTLTKPFTLSKQGGQVINEFLGIQSAPQTKPQQNRVVCPVCSDIFEQKGYFINRIGQCTGAGNAHPLDMIQLP